MLKPKASDTHSKVAIPTVGGLPSSTRLEFLGSHRSTRSPWRELLGALHPIGAAFLVVLGASRIIAFALLHGAGNGMITIAKGTLPLALFEPRGCGLRSGLLSAPARGSAPRQAWRHHQRRHQRRAPALDPGGVVLPFPGPDRPRLAPEAGRPTQVDPRHRLERASAAVRALSPPRPTGKPANVVTTAIARELVGFVLGHRPPGHNTGRLIGEIA